MTVNYRLEKSKVCLVIVDVQEKLFPMVERSCEVMHSIQKIIRGSKIMGLPIIVSEQYPEGLGPTVMVLKNYLQHDVEYVTKTTFSCLANSDIADKFLAFDQFIIVGIETHVCVLQTVKDLLTFGKQVVVLNDATSSRSIYDYSTAIAEIRDAGARISSVETVLFELVHDSKAVEFKQISDLIKPIESCSV